MWLLLYLIDCILSEIWCDYYYLWLITSHLKYNYSYVWLIAFHLKCDCYIYLIASHMKCDVIFVVGFSYVVQCTYYPQNVIFSTILPNTHFLQNNCTLYLRCKYKCDMPNAYSKHNRSSSIFSFMPTKHTVNFHLLT